MSNEGPSRSWARSRFVAVVVGMFAGGLTVLIFESAGHRLLGTADPTDFSSVTPAMFGAVLFAWIVGSGAAGAAATLWNRSGSLLPGAIAGFLLLGAAMSNTFIIEHPAWMIVAAVVLMPATAILVARRLVRSTAA